MKIVTGGGRWYWIRVTLTTLVAGTVTFYIAFCPGGNLIFHNTELCHSKRKRKITILHSFYPSRPYQVLHHSTFYLSPFSVITKSTHWTQPHQATSVFVELIQYSFMWSRSRSRVHIPATMILCVMWPIYPQSTNWIHWLAIVDLKDQGKIFPDSMKQHLLNWFTARNLAKKSFQK